MFVDGKGGGGKRGGGGAKDWWSRLQKVGLVGGLKKKILKIYELG